MSRTFCLPFASSLLSLLPPSPLNSRREPSALNRHKNQTSPSPSPSHGSAPADHRDGRDDSDHVGLGAGGLRPGAGGRGPWRYADTAGTAGSVSSAPSSTAGRPAAANDDTYGEDDEDGEILLRGSDYWQLDGGAIMGASMGSVGTGAGGTQEWARRGREEVREMDRPSNPYLTPI